MTQMKYFLPGLAIGCLVLLILPTAGCGVSGNGLGKVGDAAADGSNRDTKPAVWSAEAGSDTTPALADASLYEAAPATADDAGPDRASSDGGQAKPDLLFDDSRPSVDESNASDAETTADAPTGPDAPLVGDAGEDLLPPPDGPVTVLADGSDGPDLDTAPLDSPRPDAGPADEGADLIADVPGPDLSKPDLPPPDLGPQPTTNWVVDSTTSIGGFTPTVMGSPTVTPMDAGTAVCFDGTRDGLLFDNNPIQGMQRFTIEALLYPTLDGASQPRFIHIGGSPNNVPRLVMQMTSDASGNWNAAAVFYWGNTLTTVENTTSTHPSNQWYWVAVTYDGQTARLYVNGVLEDSANLTFGPMTTGSTSLATRQNGQYYFSGCMRDVEFFNRALPAGQLETP
jgi:hypothetical protein